MKLSEFTASQDLDLYTRDGYPVGSEDGAKQILVKKGDKIPDVFITNFLLYNRNFLANLPYENGSPKLTKEQEKKYGIKFVLLPPPKEKFSSEWNLEKLTVKLNKLGAKKFKEWAEKEFGEDTIDRRKSATGIINEIIKLEMEKKRT